MRVVMQYIMTAGGKQVAYVIVAKNPERERKSLGSHNPLLGHDPSALKLATGPHLLNALPLPVPLQAF